MTGKSKILTITALLLVAGNIAFAGTTIKKVNAVPLEYATSELPAEALLDIGLGVLDPGVSGDLEDIEKLQEKNIYPKVREAEARYIPYMLRNTIEQSNLWGAVRMVPEQDPLSEVYLNGRIVKSDGTELQVEISARDATGRHWFTKTYDDIASKFAYRDDLQYPGDVFQDIYNQVANDLYHYRQKLNSDQLHEIRTIANLRYAAALSPDAFGEHLKTDKRGNLRINRLPADDDPMMQRVQRIRESEYLFIDTVDQQFARFFHEMDPSYDNWRRFSYEEIIAERELKRSSRMRMLAGAAAVVGGAVTSSKARTRVGQVVGNAGILGGVSALRQGYDVRKQAKIHQTALQELAASFDAEIEPIVIDVQGEVVKLNGTLDAQYKEWRDILRQIYAEELGLPQGTSVNEEFTSQLEQ